jgi:hypothetical protein
MFRAGLLTLGSFYGCVFPSERTVASCSFRPRLQRRARSRFTRDSLFSSCEHPNFAPLLLKFTLVVKRFSMALKKRHPKFTGITSNVMRNNHIVHRWEEINVGSAGRFNSKRLKQMIDSDTISDKILETTSGFPGSPQNDLIEVFG